MAQEVMSMPLKSVAKDKHQECESAPLKTVAEVCMAAGLDKQVCQGVSQTWQ